jgi:hypothetical protein
MAALARRRPCAHGLPGIFATRTARTDGGASSSTQPADGKSCRGFARARSPRPRRAARALHGAALSSAGLPSSAAVGCDPTTQSTHRLHRLQISSRQRPNAACRADRRPGHLRSDRARCAACTPDGAAIRPPSSRAPRQRPPTAWKQIRARQLQAVRAQRLLINRQICVWDGAREGA